MKLKEPNQGPIWQECAVWDEVMLSRGKYNQCSCAVRASTNKPWMYTHRRGWQYSISTGQLTQKWLYGPQSKEAYLKWCHILIQFSKEQEYLVRKSVSGNPELILAVEWGVASKGDCWIVTNWAGYPLQFQHFCIKFLGSARQLRARLSSKIDHFAAQSNRACLPTGFGCVLRGIKSFWQSRLVLIVV